MSARLRLVTYNIRKGKGASGRSKTAFGRLGPALAQQAPDVLLAQEVFHTHDASHSQSEELARALGLTHVYEPNKQRKVGHHGNATITRHEVVKRENFDISTNRIERRGALYVQLACERAGHRVPVHVFNVHLGLNQRQRTTQVLLLEELIHAQVRSGECLVVAGDFNDWNRQVDKLMTDRLGLANAFAHVRGPAARTWPAGRPLFNLDRVYTRHLTPHDPKRLHGDPWRELSDHLPLSVELELPKRI